MSRYDLTDVSIHGAATTTLYDRTNALSSYAMLRAEPTVLYGQLVEDGKVIRQLARKSGTAETVDMRP